MHGQLSAPTGHGVPRSGALVVLDVVVGSPVDEVVVEAVEVEVEEVVTSVSCPAVEVLVGGGQARTSEERVIR